MQKSVAKKKTCQFQMTITSQQMHRFTQKLVSNRAETLENFKINPFCVFMKLQVRNTPISWFHEIGFKIPMKFRTHIRPKGSHHWGQTMHFNPFFLGDHDLLLWQLPTFKDHIQTQIFFFKICNSTLKPLVTVTVTYFSW